MNKKDRIKIKKGDRFGDWIIVKEVERDYCRKFLCKNSNGITRIVRMTHLRSGKSTGYFTRGKLNSNYEHGMAKTRFWIIWQGIKRRCLNKNELAYKDYGGRGIKICDKWLDFMGFYNDMFDSYSDDLTIERIDNDGNYCKKNCKWIPKIEQSRNTRHNIIIKYNNKEYKLFELAEKAGINYHTLYGRIFTYNMPIKKALKKISYRGNKYGKSGKTL